MSGTLAPPGGSRPAARSAVHAASGKRLGVARPRQEGPADLRLVPPALAAWATAALLVDASPGWVAGVAAVCAVLGGALFLRRVRAARERVTQGPVDGGLPRGPDADDEDLPGEVFHDDTTPGDRPPRGEEHRGTPTARTRTTLAALLFCVAASAVSAGLHGADLRRGPVPELGRRYATVTAEVEVTADPRLTRPRADGPRVSPGAVLITADVREVEQADGTAVATRTPVLMIVDVGEADADAGMRGGRGEALGEGPVRSPWLGLLPSTRLRVTARLAPVREDGDRIAAVMRVRAGMAPDVVGEPSGPQRFAGRLRAGLRKATDGLSADARALLPGLVVGDTARVAPELDAAFKETDLTHLLAVSGANFTILLALLLGPPGRAQHAERRGLAPRIGISLRQTAVLGGVMTLGFVVVCRPDPSVLRAAACGSVALLALATGRRRSLLPALATAVLLLVLYDPWLARSYGFLLSVLATGALLTLAPRWSEGLRRRGVPPRLAEALAAAGAAQALCAPVVAVLSARVSLVAVPCNLLAEFAVAPATVLGFAALATAPVAMPPAKVFAWCASWPAEWLAAVARTGAALPGAGVDWPGGWTGAALLGAVTVALLFAGRRLIGHPWWCGACVLLLVLVVLRPAPLTRVVTGWPPPGWRMVMCDVGQGDAMVLAAGEGTGVVVDAGPDPGLVDRCLRSLGITRIPLVVLTHFHADHVAGLPGVLRGRSVGAVETTGLAEPVEQAAFVHRVAAEGGVPVRSAAAGSERRVGELSWQVLWPPATHSPPTGHPSPVPAPVLVPEGANNASVTLLVRSAGLRFLLLGDLEPPAQRALSQSPAGAALKGVDVLKVAHHGSAHQDPDLLRRAAPRLALVSAGADNSYGHPAPATLAALRAGGAVVLRTDRDGALAVTGRAGGRLEVARD
ncbi:ComEC/Rec2 family competence protein [Streptomyces sp. NPDC005925]|uniref:ComEC/Rec2 family competence protein n=1 Tax=Streptomyces sp. NPDC005925 TaxID=3157172 RepID=UPI0033E4370A